MRWSLRQPKPNVQKSVWRRARTRNSLSLRRRTPCRTSGRSGRGTGSNCSRSRLELRRNGQRLGELLRFEEARSNTLHYFQRLFSEDTQPNYSAHGVIMKRLRRRAPQQFGSFVPASRGCTQKLQCTPCPECCPYIDAGVPSVHPQEQLK